MAAPLSFKHLMNVSTERVTVGDRELEYDRIGSGAEALIFCHGAATDGATYHAVIARLPLSRLTVYAVSSSGCGNSAKPDIDYNMPMLAEEIVAFADTLGLSKFFISGHSLGGGIAMYVTATWPDRVLGAMLIEPVPATGFSEDVITFYNSVIDDILAATPEQNIAVCGGRP